MVEGNDRQHRVENRDRKGSRMRQSNNVRLRKGEMTILKRQRAVNQSVRLARLAIDVIHGDTFGQVVEVEAVTHFHLKNR